MSETISDKENQLALLLAARNPQTGKKLFDTDASYRRECQVLQLQIAKQRDAAAVEDAKQINLDQLRWLNQAQGAMTAEERDSYGKITKPSVRLYQPGTAYQKNLDAKRIALYEGKDIAGTTLVALGAPPDTKLPPAFAEPTARQRQVAHEERSAGFGPPSYVRALPPPDVQAGTNYGGV